MSQLSVFIRLLALIMLGLALPATPLFAENVTGTLEPGNLADFVVIDKDYFSVPVAEIEDNKILMTVVGDKIIYQVENWQPGSM
jgi:predicted amidohydrolase YtcJ